ncbi:type III secretion system export apparatus subunit SctU [Thalassomonas viridans]|uniref:Type III secretion system export apparatus subunit SctU n=1 Tax=Thalassomonas viridans TaxID=137584 RepID=A0AAE9YYD2_9GAMM|nr:type III secretion system export apparatus subunit SctU [Thalassomonas viridans]WDE02827.1 type III secretion system export apparatus subunit SctU [Thalassomonas viridans]
MSEKTEQPTPKKLRDARKDGQVAQSKEVVSAATLITICSVIMATADNIVSTLQEIMLLPNRLYNQPFAKALEIMTSASLDALFALVMPIIAVTFITGIAANVIQVGPMMSAKSITPELNKISPISGFKKIFAVKNLVEFLKSVLKIALLSALIYISMIKYLPDLLNLSNCGKSCVFPLLGIMLKELIAYTAVAFIVIAAFDYFFQKSQHIKQLKMSMEEVKKEYKESEGDPQIKGQRKQLHKELLNGPAPEKVKKSSVIIANPTHVAIGLYYDKEETPLPLLTIKGTDMFAQDIKKMARDAGIPILENRPLARGLLAAAEENQYIPPEFIEPVAEVLLWVQGLADEPEEDPSLDPKNHYHP